MKNKVLVILMMSFLGMSQFACKSEYEKIRSSGDTALLLKKAFEKKQQVTKEVNEESKKTPKGESKKISLELFLRGSTIYEVAKSREMAISTIESHLADFRVRSCMQC